MSSSLLSATVLFKNLNYFNTTSLPIINLSNDNQTTNADSDNGRMDICRIFDFTIQTILMGLLLLFGLTGNSLSIIVLNTEKSKTATPFLLISLEISDTFFLLTVLFLRIIPSTTSILSKPPFQLPWTFQSLMANCGAFVFPMAFVLETTTIYLTLLVTLNRYLSVCKGGTSADHRGLARHLWGTKNARRSVFLVIVWSLLINIPRFFEYKVGEIIVGSGHDGNGFKNYSIPSAIGRKLILENKSYKIIYANIIYCLVMFLIPLSTLILLNHRLIKALGKARRNRLQLLKKPNTSDSGGHGHQSSNNGGGGGGNRNEDDITLVLIVVVLVFVFCQTPALITQILRTFLPNNGQRCPNAFFYYERISDLMIVCNSSLNFLIYCFCSKRFRTILGHLVCGLWRRGRNRGGVMSGAHHTAMVKL